MPAAESSREIADKDHAVVLLDNAIPLRDDLLVHVIAACIGPAAVHDDVLVKEVDVRSEPSSQGVSSTNIIPHSDQPYTRKAYWSIFFILAGVTRSIRQSSKQIFEMTRDA
jgi:hypothetical protein